MRITHNPTMSPGYDTPLYTISLPRLTTYTAANRTPHVPRDTSLNQTPHVPRDTPLHYDSYTISNSDKDTSKRCSNSQLS